MQVISRRGGGRPSVELRLDQVEEVADGHELFQLLLGQADAEMAFDLRHEADDVHRIEVEVFAEVLAVVQVVESLADVVFDELNEGLADLLAVRHGIPSWQVDAL